MLAKQIINNSAAPLGKSVLAGFAGNGFLTFLLNVADKIADIPKVYIKENPDISIQDFIRKYADFAKEQSNFNIAATFGLFGAMALSLLLTALIKNWLTTGHCLPTNPQPIGVANHASINDSNQTDINAPIEYSWKTITKAAGLALVFGAAAWGVISFIRSSILRNFPEYLLDQGLSVEDIEKSWSTHILTNIIGASILMGMALAVLTPLFLYRPIQSLFFRPNNTNQLNEETRLVAALPEPEKEKPILTPTT